MTRASGKAPHAELALELFMFLAEVRAANAESLHVLFFAAKGVPFRTMMRRLAALVKTKHLARMRLRGSRSIYRLTAKSFALVRAKRPASNEILRRRPAERQADYCWLRSCLCASLTKDGYCVGRTTEAQVTLRRSLLDAPRPLIGNDALALLVAQRTGEELRAHPALRPVFRCTCAQCGWRGRLMESAKICPRCRKATETSLAKEVFKCAACESLRDRLGVHEDPRRRDAVCGGALKRIDPLPFDVAWRKRGGRREVLIVFIDNPSRSLEAQLAELPLGIDGQPRVDVILRSVDPDSQLGSDGKTWLSVGLRHRALLRAFRARLSADGDELDDDGATFAASANVIDPYPMVHVHG